MPRNPIPPKVRWLVFSRDGYRCRYCGSRPPAVALVIDHRIPVALGGTDELSNLITSCEDCNSGKGAIPPTAETPTATGRTPRDERWDRLVALVPELLTLREEVERNKAHEGFCANEVWYGPAGYRRQVIELVGANSGHLDPWVRTSEAYDTAYRTLYNLLPDCDHEDTICRRGLGW